MKAFITGATGFIGGALARQLAARGDTVICLVRDPARAGDLKKIGAQLVRGDITEPATLREPMRGADVVYHLAGSYQYGPKYIPQMRAINVDGARNVLELAAELGVPKIVHTSSVAVFGDTRHKIMDESYRTELDTLPTEYERTKWQAHYEVAVPLQARGAPLIITQPGVVTGPRDPSPHMQIMEFYLNRFPMAFGAESGVSWSHVEDIANGHILAAERGKPGESYILAGPSLTWKQVQQKWQEITKIPPAKIWIPGWMIGANQIMIGAMERVGLPTPFSAEGLASMRDCTFWGSPAKAEQTLGWKQRPLMDAFREVLEYEMNKRSKR